MKLLKRKDKKMYYPRNEVMRLHKAYILTIISLIIWSFVASCAIDEYVKLQQATVVKTPIVYAKEVKEELKKEGLKEQYEIGFR